MPNNPKAIGKISRLGPFEVLEKLGSGRTSEVFKVRRDDLISVLKIIKSHLKFDTDAVSAILQESKILEAIGDNQHFPRLFEAGKIEDSHYLSMEYVHGLNLKDTLHRGSHYLQTLSIEDSCFIAAEICAGLEYLHGLQDPEGRPIVHRDIKTSNVVLSTDGAVKLIDLSLKHGTFKYTPLERLENKSTGPYSDIFATGHLLYETLHGRPLIRSESQLDGYFEMKQLRIDENYFDSTLPAAIRRILSRSLGQDSKSRYESVTEFKQDLMDLLGASSPRKHSQELGRKVAKLKELPKLHPILPMGRLQKTDPEGFFVNDASLTKIRPPWSEAVEAIKEIYLRHIPERIHSLYLRGSVSVGRAIQGLSDIDSIAVIDGDPQSLDFQWVGPAQIELRKRFPFCPYVEFDFVPLDRLLTEPGYFSRRFAIKVLSICFHGEDLSLKIPKFKPSLEIAYYFHGNIEQVVDQAKARIRETSESEEIKVCCTWVMKRLLRTGFELTIEQSKVFTRDLYPCYDIFSKFYPKEEPHIWQALEWSINPIDDKSRLLDYLNSFGAWLTAEAKNKLSRFNRPS